jgi:O-antigen/teichoic acid export membrane protein
VKRAGSTLTRDTMNGMLWVAFGHGGRVVLQFLVLAILARLLTPEDFGVVSAALVVIGFAAIFSQLGLGPALVQRPNLEPRHVQAAFTGSVGFGLLLGLAIWLAAPVAATFFRIEGIAPVLRVLAWTFPLKGIAVVSESLLQRDMGFRWLANRELASYGLGYGLVGVALAWNGAGVWALVGANMAQAVVNTALLVIARPPSVRLRIDWAACRELASFGGGFTAAKIGNRIALQGDNLVVGRWLGAEALGIYGRAYHLMAMPAALFGDIVDTALFPAMAKVQDQPQRLESAYRRGISLVALVVLPASVVLFTLAPELVYLLLGPKWSSVVIPFQVLAAGMLFRTSYKLSDSICRATGAVYRRAWRQAVFAFAVVGGAWVGQHWGVNYVAVGVLVALLINFLLMAHLSLSVCGMTWGRFFMAHAAALPLTATSAAVAWSLVSILRHWESPAALRLIIPGGISLALVTWLAWRMPRLFLGGDGLWMIQFLRDQLSKRLQRGRRAGSASVASEPAARAGADA